ncbi:MAG: hypothetical protein KKF44_00910 [Nanoarchaeota archaeon]|nr:hypothetical protein [Nanoarchaeota archaeon]
MSDNYNDVQIDILTSINIKDIKKQISDKINYDSKDADEAIYVILIGGINDIPFWQYLSSNPDTETYPILTDEFYFDFNNDGLTEENIYYGRVPTGNDKEISVLRDYIKFLISIHNGQEIIKFKYDNFDFLIMKGKYTIIPPYGWADTEKFIEIYTGKNCQNNRCLENDYSPYCCEYVPEYSEITKPMNRNAWLYIDMHGLSPRSNKAQKFCIMDTYYDGEMLSNKDFFKSISNLLPCFGGNIDFSSDNSIVVALMKKKNLAIIGSTSIVYGNLFKYRGDVCTNPCASNCLYSYFLNTLADSENQKSLGEILVTAKKIYYLDHSKYDDCVVDTYLKTQIYMDPTLKEREKLVLNEKKNDAFEVGRASNVLQELT